MPFSERHREVKQRPRYVGQRAMRVAGRTKSPRPPQATDALLKQRQLTQRQPENPIQRPEAATKNQTDIEANAIIFNVTGRRPE